MRAHNDALNRIDFIDLAPEVGAEPAPGGTLDLPQPDGNLRLRKLHANHDPTSRRSAMNHRRALQDAGEIPTGLLYVDAEAGDLHTALNTVAQPLNTLDADMPCPGAKVLAKINAGLR